MPGAIKQPRTSPETITAERKGLWSVYDPAVRKDVMDWIAGVDGFGSTDRASKGLCLIHGGAVAIALLETLGYTVDFVNWERVKEHNPHDKGISVKLDGQAADDKSMPVAVTLADVEQLATEFFDKVAKAEADRLQARIHDVEVQFGEQIAAKVKEQVETENGLKAEIRNLKSQLDKKANKAKATS